MQLVKVRHYNFTDQNLPLFTAVISANLQKSLKQKRFQFFFHLLNPIFSTRIDKLMVMKLFEPGVNLIKPFCRKFTHAFP